MTNKLDINIRNLTKHDFNKGYIQLLEQLTNETNQVTNDEFAKFIYSLDNNHIIIVIENNNEIIATGTLLIEHKLIHGVKNVGHIEDIVVDNKYKKFGLGKFMINYLEELAKTLDCYKIILNCTNEFSGFYEKCGFINKGNCMSLYF
jgi:glucosamine-phosphate N-acetyltransferase